MLPASTPRPATGVRLLCDTAADLGIERAACLAGTGLSVRDVYDEDGRVTLDQELVAIENLVGLARQPAGLGVAVARRLHVNSFGIWGFAVLTSPTVRAAIATAIDYLRLSLVLVDLRLSEGRDEAGIVFDTGGLAEGTRRFVLERHALVTMLFLREVVGADRLTEVRIETASTDPSYPAALGPLVDLAVVGSRPADALVFPADLLDAEVPRSDPVTLRYCLEQCDLLAAQLGDEERPWSRRVQDAVTSDIGVEHTIGAVASELMVNERTLRRRLADEGTTFRQVYTEARLSIARELLETAGLSVESVARRVGYAEPASFARAFTRWHGTTPGRVRRAPVP